MDATMWTSESVRAWRAFALGRRVRLGEASRASVPAPRGTAWALPYAAPQWVGADGEGYALGGSSSSPNAIC